jgi:hypothetical protein
MRILDFSVMRITDRYADAKYYAGGTANDALFFGFQSRKTNMSKKLKLAVLAAVLATTGAISSPVLAAGWDDDWFEPPSPCLACRDWPPEPLLAMNGAISSPAPQHQMPA